jgi:hypothetical protein
MPMTRPNAATNASQLQACRPMSDARSSRVALAPAPPTPMPAPSDRGYLPADAHNGIDVNIAGLDATPNSKAAANTIAITILVALDVTGGSP